MSDTICLALLRTWSELTPGEQGEVIFWCAAEVAVIASLIGAIGISRGWWN